MKRMVVKTVIEQVAKVVVTMVVKVVVETRGNMRPAAESVMVMVVVVQGSENSLLHMRDGRDGPEHPGASQQQSITEVYWCVLEDPPATTSRAGGW